MNKETYLGDGVYASFDGFQIVLRAPRGFVILDPDVYKELQEFVIRLKNEDKK